MIASGQRTVPIDLVRVMKLDDSWLGTFTPLGFAPADRGRMHPTYPPGLPMHLALAGIVGGWRHAPFLLIPIFAVASLALTFAIGRRLDLPVLLAAVAPVAIAFLPPFLLHAVQPASDVLAMFWALAAIYRAPATASDGTGAERVR